MSTIVSKIFVEYSSIKELFTSKYNDAKINNDMLKYEVKMYKYITDTLIKTNVAPNFIGYIGYGECSIRNIQPSVVLELRKILGLKKYGIDEEKIDFNSLKVGVLLTYRPKNVETFGTFLTKSITYEQYYKVLFQLFYSLFVMQKYEIAHNDLHRDNILVETVPHPILLSYKMGDFVFEFETDYILYIFDWDRGYCKEVGDNNLDFFCRNYNQCNLFNKYNDMFTILCYLGYNEIPKQENAIIDAYDEKRVEIEISPDDAITLFPILHDEPQLKIQRRYFNLKQLLFAITNPELRRYVISLNLNTNGGVFEVRNIEGRFYFRFFHNKKQKCIPMINLAKTKFDTLDYLIYVGNQFKKQFDIRTLAFYEIDIDKDDFNLLKQNVLTKNGVEYPNLKTNENIVRVKNSDFFNRFYTDIKKQRKEFCKFKIEKLFHTINLNERYDGTQQQIHKPDFEQIKTFIISCYKKLNLLFLKTEEKVEITEESYSQIQNDDSDIAKLYVFHFYFYNVKDLMIQLISNRFSLTNILYEYGIYMMENKFIDKINEINKNSYNIDTKVFDIETYKYIDIFEPNHKVNFKVLLSSISMTEYLDYEYNLNNEIKTLYIHPNMANSFGEKTYIPSNDAMNSVSSLYHINL